MIVTQPYFKFNLCENYNNQESKVRVLTWSEYNTAIMNLFFTYLYSEKSKPDYIIGVGEDSFIMGNALSRLFGKNVGYILIDSKGNLAEHISIIKQPSSDEEEQGEEVQKKPLSGSVLLVSLTQNVDFSKVQEKIRKNSLITEITQRVLFEDKRDEIIAPDEIFKNLDLSYLKPEDLAHLGDEEIAHIAVNLYAELCSNPLKKMVVTDLKAIPETVVSFEQEQPEPSVLSVSWDEYGIMKIESALRMIKNNSKPDLCVGLARGGLDFAKGFSYIFNVPMAVYTETT